MFNTVYERPALVTPEAVEIHLETAGPGSRILAALIDLFIIFQLIGALLVLLTSVSLDGESEVIFMIGSIIGYPLIIIGYPIASETLWRGKTLGKAALGLRVVTSLGAPIRFRHAAIRAFVGLFEFQLTGGIAALIAILASKDGRRLGDMAAGTLVIRVRQASTRTAVPFAFIPHPGDEEFASRLDVSRVDNEMHQAIRSFLLRAQDLTPDARWILGVKFATAASRRLKVSPPEGMHPESFLVSVVAASQQWTPSTPRPAPQVWGQAPSSPFVEPTPVVAGSVWTRPNPTHVEVDNAESPEPPSPAPLCTEDDGFSAPT